MSHPRHNERLLSDVLSEGGSADFRESLLGQTLSLARRRRRFLQARRATAALAVAGALGLLLWHLSPPGRGPSGGPAKPYSLVRTQPLPKAAWVETKPFPADGLVASLATSHVFVTRGAGDLVREIDDDELLALVPAPAALVRHGPHSAELVFVSTEDRDDLLRN